MSGVLLRKQVGELVEVRLIWQLIESHKGNAGISKTIGMIPLLESPKGSVIWMLFE